MPDGIDQSWSYADPNQAKAAGVKVVSMYLSHDASKNATAAKIKAYHAVGIGVLLNWESDAGRPLLGAGAGAEDGHDAVAQVDLLISQVGYAPANRLAIPFSCDTDVNSSQYPQIDGYYAATRSALGDRYLNGVYGQASVVGHLHAKGLTQMEWQTLAWSGGVIDPEADFYQSSINDTLGGASVDFDRIIHADKLGAWWPPGHPLNTEDDMSFTLEQIAEAVWNHQVHRIDSKGAASSGNHPAFSWLTNGSAYASQAAQAAASGGVDIDALAQKTAALLGPELSKQFLAALGDACTKGAA